MQINPYVMYNGNCEAAFNFYTQLLGTKILGLMKYGGSPAEGHVPAEMADKVLHVAMHIGENLLMASDAPTGQFQKPQGFSVNLTVDSAAEADRVYNALADGGKVQMAINRTFWAERFGMVEDKFGMPWMVNYTGDVKPPHIK